METVSVVEKHEISSGTKGVLCLAALFAVFVACMDIAYIYQRITSGSGQFPLEIHFILLAFFLASWRDVSGLLIEYAKRYAQMVGITKYNCRYVGFVVAFWAAVTLLMGFFFSPFGLSFLQSLILFFCLIVPVAILVPCDLSKYKDYMHSSVGVD